MPLQDRASCCLRYCYFHCKHRYMLPTVGGVHSWPMLASFTFGAVIRPRLLKKDVLADS